jgi:hypothetical protein
MKSTTKIVIWASVALVLAGGAVGIYFLAKPKDGQTRTKKGKNQTYKDGKWVNDSSEIPIPMPDGGGGGTSGRKSCYNANVEKLQIYLNSKGAKLETDGCRGDKTNKAMAKYEVEFDGTKYWEKNTNNEPIIQPAVAKRTSGKVGSYIYTEKSISTKNPEPIYRKASSIMFGVTPFYNEVKPNFLLGTMFELNRTTQGVWYAGFIDNSGNKFYVNYNNIYSLE